MGDADRRSGVIIGSAVLAVHRISEEERAQLRNDDVHGSVFSILGDDGAFKIVSHRGKQYRVEPHTLHEVPNPKYVIGDVFDLHGRKAKVTAVCWHYKRAEPYYLLNFDGRQSTNRYFVKDVDNGIALEKPKNLGNADSRANLKQTETLGKAGSRDAPRKWAWLLFPWRRRTPR